MRVGRWRVRITVPAKLFTSKSPLSCNSQSLGLVLLWVVSSTCVTFVANVPDLKKVEPGVGPKYYGLLMYKFPRPNELWPSFGEYPYAACLTAERLS